MERRAFVAGSLGLLAAPFAAKAQQAGKVYRIGILTLPIGPSAPIAAEFRQRLREHGYGEGQNIALEYRFADGRVERLPALAPELVRMNLDIIVTESTAAALAAKQATQTIPIVMAIVSDAVRAGLVAGLARPGGNITGLSMVAQGVSGKRLQLLMEVVPNTRVVGVIRNPSKELSENKRTQLRS